jgi:tRNA pseudouridine38-40 synthase
MNGRFRMVALWCWYRGEKFRGYQQQAGVRTVQGEILRAFSTAGLTRNPVVAGRTDRGVSARMQVLSGRLDRDVAPESLIEILNPLLADDLGLHLAREVKPKFHAAFSAHAKEYRYALSGDEGLDLERLRDVAELIPGTRNFKAFHFKTSEEKPRTVHSVEVLEGPLRDVTVRFVGQGFARYMVRMLMGGMLAVARGEVSIDVLRAGLVEARFFHCPTAAAEPLTLWEVAYPPQVDPFTAAERSAFTWPRERRSN